MKKQNYRNLEGGQIDRENIYGVQTETWHHSNGCRLWLKVKRSTITHEIHSVEPAQKGLAKVLREEK